MDTLIEQQAELDAAMDQSVLDAKEEIEKKPNVFERFFAFIKRILYYNIW